MLRPGLVLAAVLAVALAGACGTKEPAGQVATAEPTPSDPIPSTSSTTTAPEVTTTTTTTATATTTSAPATNAVTTPPAAAAAPAAPAPPAATLQAPPTTTAPARPASVGAEAARLAGQIRTAHATVVDPAAPKDALAAAAHLEQQVFRNVVNQPELAPPLYAALPAELRGYAEANVTAGLRLRSMTTRPRQTFPDWRIVPPAPAGELLSYYKEAEAAYGVPWAYLAGIHLVETRMGRIRGVSSAGAQGPMQFMPATWAAFGQGDVNDNRDAIFAAARYLKRNGAPGDMRNALWNYNHDNRYVDAVVLHAQQMQADERNYFGYHGWQVYYVMVGGDALLHEGWTKPA